MNICNFGTQYGMDLAQTAKKGYCYNQLRDDSALLGTSECKRVNGLAFCSTLPFQVKHLNFNNFP